MLRNKCLKIYVNDIFHFDYKNETHLKIWCSTMHIMAFFLSSRNNSLSTNTKSSTYPWQMCRLHWRLGKQTSRALTRKELSSIHSSADCFLWIASRTVQPKFKMTTIGSGMSEKMYVVGVLQLLLDRVLTNTLQKYFNFSKPLQ